MMQRRKPTIKNLHLLKMLIFNIDQVLRSLHKLIARILRLSMVCFVSFKISVTEKGFVQFPPAYALGKAKLQV